MILTIRITVFLSHYNFFSYPKIVVLLDTFQKNKEMHLDGWADGRLEGSADGRTAAGRTGGRAARRTDDLATRRSDGAADGRLGGRTGCRKARRTDGGREDGRLEAVA